MPIITLTTDFGTGSPYVAAMKGVILDHSGGDDRRYYARRSGPGYTRGGLFRAGGTTPWFPDDTIHVAVVDPGVGTARSNP